MKRKSVLVLAKKSEKLRVELHLTQKEVADETHITESAYALLENEDIFGYTVRDIDRTAAIAIGCGLSPARGFFAEFIHDWENMRKKLNNHEIAKDEYEAWKRT